MYSYLFYLSLNFEDGILSHLMFKFKKRCSCFGLCMGDRIYNMSIITNYWSSAKTDLVFFSFFFSMQSLDLCFMV